MGGNESSDKDRDMTVGEHIKEMFRKSPYLETDLPTSSKDDERFGECTIMEANNDQKIVKKRLKVTDDRKFVAYLNNKKQRVNFNHNLFVKLLDYDSDVCNEKESEDSKYKYYIDCYFDYFDNDLKFDIKQRRSNEQPYSNEEMRRFMHFFIQCGTYLEAANSRHSDIRPEFVCLDGEGKPLLVENVRDKAGTGTRLAFAAGSHLYCSPIIYKHYCRNVMKVKHDKKKDDVFSSGLILLEMGLLNSIQSIYDQDEGRIRSTILSELIEQFTEKYSTAADVCQGVRQMLVIDEGDRPSFLDLAAKLKVPVNNLGIAGAGNVYNNISDSSINQSAYGNYGKAPPQTAFGSSYGQNPVTNVPSYPKGGNPLAAAGTFGRTTAHNPQSLPPTQNPLAGGFSYQPSQTLTPRQTQAPQTYPANHYSNHVSYSNLAPVHKPPVQMTAPLAAPMTPTSQSYLPKPATIVQPQPPKPATGAYNPLMGGMKFNKS